MAHHTGYHVRLDLTTAHQQIMRDYRAQDRLARQVITAHTARPGWWTLACQQLARRIHAGRLHIHPVGDA